MKKAVSQSIAQQVVKNIPVLLTEANIEATIDEMIAEGYKLITDEGTWFDWADKLRRNVSFDYMPYLIVKQVYTMLKTAKEINDLLTIMKGGN